MKRFFNVLCVLFIFVLLFSVVSIDVYADENVQDDNSEEQQEENVDEQNESEEVKEYVDEVNCGLDSPNIVSDEEIDTISDDLLNTQIVYEDFDDVFVDDYYYDAVMIMRANGFVYGVGGNCFAPRSNLTVAESLTLLFRIAGLTVENEPNSVWYQGVTNVAKELGIIPYDLDVTKPATRYEVAEMIINIFGLNTEDIIVENVFVDTNSVVANTMYQYGIFFGIPGEDGVTFKPDSYILRGDICLVLYRITDIENLSCDINEISENLYLHNNPTNTIEFFNIFKRLVYNSDFSVKVDYTTNIVDNEYFDIIRSNACSAYQNAFVMFPEKFCSVPLLSFKRTILDTTDGSGYILFTCKSDFFSDSEIFVMQTEFVAYCKNVINSFIESGIINDSLSDFEKIKLMFDYVVNTVSYDTEYNPYSFIGYGAAINGKAVCQGYTALFNELCSLLGYETEGVSGYIKETFEGHLWSKIKIDGVWHYFDTTFADVETEEYSFCDYTYFDIPYDFLELERYILIDV